MENAFIVQGGKPLKGTVELEGAKNISLKVAIAALLFDAPITFHNMPELQDIKELFHVLKTIGVDVTFEGNTAVIDPRTLETHEVDMLHGSRVRTLFMMFAPFIKKFKRAHLPNPGGCRIGARPIDRMVGLMTAFGIETTYHSDSGYYDAQLKTDKLMGANYTFKKKTHTGTELALMFAAVAEGESIIGNASLEPEIDELITLLQMGGAAIERKGEDIHVVGVEKLKNVESFDIAPDRNNAVTYAIFALATKGDVIVKGAREPLLKVFLQNLDIIGGKYEILDSGIRFYYEKPLKAIDITTSPHPGFMTDWQAPWAVLMTQAHGTSRIHETVFENRFGYVSELNKLGAHIEYYRPEVEDPEELYQFDIKNMDAFRSSYQGILIHGPTHLHGGVLHVTDMRAGATLLIGACAAEGESVIVGAAEIDRGYEYIEKRLTALGADIRRV